MIEKNKFIKLTGPNSLPVYVNPQFIGSISSEDNITHISMIFLNDKFIDVMESPDEIIKIINKSSGFIIKTK
jgi:uncharacterized protein YlzI (FlbEa/FlbD family)